MSQRFQIQAVLRSFVATCALLVGDAVWAVNLAFMPGDAFFHSRLSQQSVVGLDANAACVELTYSYPIEAATFGGYAGFSKLRIEETLPTLIQNLANVYEQLRNGEPIVVQLRGSEDKPERLELNPFHLLVYNRSVDWQRQRIGFKYNERWMELPAEALNSPSRKLGPFHTKAVRYVSLMRGARAISHDWEFAAQYDALQVEIPKEIAWGVSGPEIVEPIKVKSDNIQLVVLPEPGLKSYFVREDDTEFYSLTNDDCRRFWWDNGKLRVANFP